LYDDKRHVKDGKGFAPVRGTRNSAYKPLWTTFFPILETHRK
jgi:hypothetical protein